MVVRTLEPIIPSVHTAQQVGFELHTKKLQPLVRARQELIHPDINLNLKFNYCINLLILLKKVAPKNCQPCVVLMSKNEREKFKDDVGLSMPVSQHTITKNVFLTTKNISI